MQPSSGVIAPPVPAIYSGSHKWQMPMCSSPWDARCVKNLVLAQTLHGQCHGQVQLLPPCGWGEHKPGWFTQCDWPPRNTLALLHQTEWYSLLLRYPVTPFHNSPFFFKDQDACCQLHWSFSPPRSHCHSDKFSQGSLPRLAATVTRRATGVWGHGCPVLMLSPFPSNWHIAHGKDEQLGMGKTRRLV